MRIPSTRIRNKLKSDQAAFGVTLQMPSPDEVEIAGHAGLDYIWIDAEHGTMDLGDINVMVRAADAVGIDSIVRVPDQTPSFIQRVLDTGATGILVPHMRTPEDARAIVAAATYAPPGIRGACPTIRAFGHMSANWAEDLSRARKDVLVFGLIEDIEGVENIEAIAAAGLDAVMFGPFDLAVALGLDGNVKHPKIVEMGARVRRAAVAAGIQCFALLGWDAGTLESLAAEGVRIFNIGGDKGGLFVYLRDAKRKADEAFAQWKVSA